MRAPRRGGGRARWWGRVWNRIVRIDDSPGRIAGGVALGVSLGIAPTFGLGAVAAAFLAAWLRLNMAAAVAGSVIGIPLIAPFIWVFSSWLGGLFLGLDWRHLYGLAAGGEILKAGGAVLWAYVIGNVILTVVAAVSAYFGVLWLLRARVRTRGRAGGRRRPARARGRS